MTLENFPRGGKKAPVKQETDTLFRAPPVEKPKKKKAKVAKVTNENSSEQIFTLKTAQCLSYLTIQEGMVVLGRIQQVSEYDLYVSLPGGVKGIVQVTNICETYTKLLEDIIKSKETESMDFKPLTAMYNVGEYIVCYVKSLLPKNKVALSLEPQLINQSLDHKQLTKGSKVSGVVSSIEDHGYVIDTGIGSLRAFVATADCDKEQQFSVGRQVFCAVKKIKVDENASTIKLSTKAKHTTSVFSCEDYPLDSLIPGTKFTLIVTKVLKNGLQVFYNGEHVGYVNQIYLQHPISSYTEGEQYEGTLMYVIPTVKFAYFSLLSNEPETERLEVGDVIENAKVKFREGSGIIMKLKKGIRGFIPFRFTDVKFENIPEVYCPDSKHKCRIIVYSYFDRLYISTARKDMMNQQFHTTASINPGDVLDVKIVQVDQIRKIVNIKAGKINGKIIGEHLSTIGPDRIEKLKVGQAIKVRVLTFDDNSKNIYCTMKKPLVDSKLPILSDINEAKVGSKHHGVIVQITKYGVLVKFFGEVKGWIPKELLNKETASMNWNFSIGQVIATKIEEVRAEQNKIILGMADGHEKPPKLELKIGDSVEGTIIESSVNGVHLKITKENEESAARAFLPAGHMAPCAEVGGLLASRCVPGDTLSALVFSVTPTLILTRTIVPQEQYTRFSTLKKGDSIPCSISEILENGIKVILPVLEMKNLVFIPFKHISNFSSLYKHQVLFAKIIGIKEASKEIHLTTHLDEIVDDLNVDSYTVSVDLLSLYFNKLDELSNLPYYASRPISSAKIGQRVTGKVEKITPDGLVLTLENDLKGIVRKDHNAKNLKVGDAVSGSIVWVNYVYEIVDVTLLPVLMHGITPKQTKIDLPEDVQLFGKVIFITNWFVLALVKSCIVALPIRRHINDIVPNLKPYDFGNKIKCFVVLNREQVEIMPVCMLKSLFVLKQSESSKKKETKLKRKGETVTKDETPVVKKSKTDKNCNKKVDSEKTKKSKKKDHAKNTDQEHSTNIKSEEEEEKEFSVTSNGGTSAALPECGFFWDAAPDPTFARHKESSSESEDEDDLKPKEKKKKLNATERRELERQKEREIREREEALASNQMPNSVDQFDRLVLASPDSSLVWMQYMAFHLQATEIEKARAVARRAIKTINFREENERLNVWNAWLNLESRFGSPESVNDVFQEAVRTNDALKIYTHMLTVHAEAGRQAELEKMISAMIGKFKSVPQMWVDCGLALLRVGLKEKSRHIMQRAIQSLPAKQHVDLMVRFAQLENKFGDKERAQTLFEQILSSYPKRVDVWSSYVDVLVKSDDIDIARKVLERAVVQTLPARKMKTLFKKFIKFEEQYGTPEAVAQVKQLAVDYVEKQCKNDPEEED